MTLAAVAGRLVGLAAACVAYGTFVETRQFVVRRVNVPVLPADAPRLRVLHLSDLHVATYNKARLEFIATLAGLEPDLVVNTGDNIVSAAAIEPLRRAFGRLLERPGVYVYGSNDYAGPVPQNPFGYLRGPTGGGERTGQGRDGGQSTVEDVQARADGREPEEAMLPTADLGAMLSGGGWVDVAGRRVTLDVEGVRVEIRGTDDAHVGRDDYALVAGPASAGVDVSLGVTHSPYQRLLDAMARDDVDLVLAGHTHGGQVRVPIYGALVTNCDLPRENARGLSEHRTRRHASWLNVSAGLGQSPYAPFRFACRPEVTLVTLTPRSNG